MSLFERFMLWAGFVRTRRVLDGLAIVEQRTLRLSVGEEIFGRRFIPMEIEDVIRASMDPTLVSASEAAAGFRNLDRALKDAALFQLKPKKTTKGRKKHG